LLFSGKKNFCCYDELSEHKSNILLGEENKIF